MVIQFGFGVAVLLLSVSSAWAGTTPVAAPEPASMALLATGVGALAVYRLRRRK